MVTAGGGRAAVTPPLDWPAALWSVRGPQQDQCSAADADSATPGPGGGLLMHGPTAGGWCRCLLACCFARLRRGPQCLRGRLVHRISCTHSGMYKHVEGRQRFAANAAPLPPSRCLFSLLLRLLQLRHPLAQAHARLGRRLCCRRLCCRRLASRRCWGGWYLRCCSRRRCGWRRRWQRGCRGGRSGRHHTQVAKQRIEHEAALQAWGAKHGSRGQMLAASAICMQPNHSAQAQSEQRVSPHRWCSGHGGRRCRDWCSNRRRRRCHRHCWCRC